MILFPMLQSTMTSMPDPWLLNEINHDNSITYTNRTNDLRWTQEPVNYNYPSIETYTHIVDIFHLSTRGRMDECLF